MTSITLPHSAASVERKSSQKNGMKNSASSLKAEKSNYQAITRKYQTCTR